jgi:hypothetical protein
MKRGGPRGSRGPPRIALQRKQVRPRSGGCYTSSRMSRDARATISPGTHHLTSGGSGERGGEAGHESRPFRPRGETRGGLDDRSTTGEQIRQPTVYRFRVRVSRASQCDSFPPSGTPDWLRESPRGFACFLALRSRFRSRGISPPRPDARKAPLCLLAKGAVALSC